MLGAGFVVVADPYGYHFAPQDQKIVLAHQILNNKNIGQAYEKLPFEVILDDNRRVFIYRKTRKFTRQQLAATSEMFIRFYPADREKFALSVELIEALSEV